MQYDFFKLLKRCFKLHRGDIVIISGTVNDEERAVIRQLAIKTGIFFIVGDDGINKFERLDDLALARMGLYRRPHQIKPSAPKIIEGDTED